MISYLQLFVNLLHSLLICYSHAIYIPLFSSILEYKSNINNLPIFSPYVLSSYKRIIWIFLLIIVSNISIFHISAPIFHVFNSTIFSYISLLHLSLLKSSVLITNPCSVVIASGWHQLNVSLWVDAPANHLSYLRYTGMALMQLDVPRTSQWKLPWEHKLSFNSQVLQWPLTTWTLLSHFLKTAGKWFYICNAVIQFGKRKGLTRVEAGKNKKEEFASLWSRRKKQR